MTITMPIYWYISKKRPKEPLWLNWYRNCHFRTLNKVKQDYTAEVTKQLNWEQINGQYGVCIQLYLHSTAQDIDNFSCIATKFILDALVKAWALQGDSNKHFTEIHSVFKGIDKQNPRITLTII